MRLGMIGLGRMGGSMAERLILGGHELVVYDVNVQPIEYMKSQGATGTASIKELVDNLTSPKIIWIMVPQGKPTDEVIDELIPYLDSGDILIDGGNANYKDTQIRSEKLAAYDINLIDVGISGGVWGLSDGYSLMVGGHKEIFSYIEPILKTLAPNPTLGYMYAGHSGAGHFVKMVHNGVEYGLMQAYAEGFELLRSKDEFGFNLSEIANTWRYGSVVRSWLLDLVSRALHDDPNLGNLSSYVEDSGEGRWTVQESVDLGVPIPAITAALQQRFRSRQDQPFSGRLLAALRYQFGGHAVHEVDKNDG